MKPTDFVLWNAKENCFDHGRGHFSSLASAEEFLSRPVAPEITQLVEELTAYFGRIGMHRICKSCFAGKKLPPIKGSSWYHIYGHYGNHGNGGGVGCCKPCGLQGHKGCLSKPLGCALWMCNYTSTRFPQAQQLLTEVKQILWANKVPDNFFTDERPRKLTLEQTRGVLLAIKLLREARQEGRAA